MAKKTKTPATRRPGTHAPSTALATWSREQLSFTLPGATPSSLSLPDTLTWDQWERFGKALRPIHEAFQWWVGDWLKFGEDHFGERYAQAMDATGHSYESIQRYARVAKRVAPEVRRADLPWSHHAEVASVEPEAQRTWLAKAAKQGWSKQDLREAIKAAKGADDGAGDERDTPRACKCCEGGCQEPTCRCATSS